METARRISRNTAYLAAAEIVSRVLQFVVILYAARLLSQSDFGIFNLALSLSFIAMIFSDVGINTYLIREISRNRKLASQYFYNAFVLKGMLIAFAVVMGFALMEIAQPRAGSLLIISVIWLFAIISTFTDLTYSVFRAFEKMHNDSAIKILRMVLLASSSLFVLISGFGVVALSMCFVIVELIIFIVAFAIARKNYLKGAWNLDWSFILILLKKSLPFGFSLVFGSIYFYIGTIMLSGMKGDVEVALFSSAYNITLALLFIPTVYTNAIYPVLSRYFTSSKELLGLLYERSFKYLYLIGLPLSVGLYALSERIILLLYGEHYLPATLVLKIISGYLFLKFLNFHLGITLSSINRQKERMIGQGITALVNIGLNILLIPRYGINGAAFSTLITEVVLFGIYYNFVSGELHSHLSIGGLLKPLLASAALFGVIAFTHLPLIFLILAGALCYGAIIILLRTLDKTDWRIIKGIMDGNGTAKK